MRISDTDLLKLYFIFLLKVSELCGAYFNVITSNRDSNHLWVVLNKGKVLVRVGSVISQLCPVAPAHSYRLNFNKKCSCRLKVGQRMAGIQTVFWAAEDGGGSAGGGGGDMHPGRWRLGAVGWVDIY